MKTILACSLDFECPVSCAAGVEDVAGGDLLAYLGESVC